MSVKNSVIRSCLFYEFKLGSKASEAANRICLAFGKNTITVRTTQRWFRKFSTGDESLEDKTRSGRPSNLKVDELKSIIETHSTLTCKQLADLFDVSDETIRKHLHKIGKKWECSKWVTQTNS